MGSINYSLTESYKANYSFMKNMKLKLKFNNNFEFTESDLGIIRNRKNKRNDIYKKSCKILEKRIDNQGNKYLYVAMPSSISILGNRFLEDNPDYIYIAIHNSYFKIKDEMKISLRSLGYPVNLIAKEYGGGGHKESASFSFSDREKFEKFVKGDFHLI